MALAGLAVHLPADPTDTGTCDWMPEELSTYFRNPYGFVPKE
jgi:hypothetical protein